MREARVNAQETSHALHIQVTQELDLWERLGFAAAAGVIFGFAASMLLSSFWWLAIAPLVSLAILAVVKDRKAELTVSQFEFVARGDLGRRTRRLVVMAADVRGLEFQDGSVFPSAKGGLHVRTGRSSFLILPYLDWKQTQQIIDAIKKKLPGLSENWR